MINVSIIIPSWNRGNVIRECLDSIPLCPNIEVIVVDDGSTDNTCEVVNSYTRIPVKYVYQENKGPGPARDTGIRNSKNDYIFLLDSDDTVFGDKFLEALECVDDFDITRLKCTTDGINSNYIFEMRGSILKKSILEGIHHMPGVFRGEDTLFTLFILKYKNPSSHDVDLCVYKYNVCTEENSLSNTLKQGDRETFYNYLKEYKIENELFNFWKE